jgi:hypothetical protein
LAPHRSDYYERHKTNPIAIIFLIFPVSLFDLRSLFDVSWEQKRGGRDLFADDKSLRWSGEVSADQKSIPPAHRQGFVLLYCMAQMLKASIPKISKLGFIHGEMECNMTLNRCVDIYES